MIDGTRHRRRKQRPSRVGKPRSTRRNGHRVPLCSLDIIAHPVHTQQKNPGTNLHPNTTNWGTEGRDRLTFFRVGRVDRNSPDGNLVWEQSWLYRDGSDPDLIEERQ